MKIRISCGDSSRTAAYAKKELRSFLEQYSGALFTDGPADLAIEMTVDPALDPFAWSVRSVPGKILLSGGTASSLLSSVYELLEAMGLRFTTEGESLAKPFALDGADGLDVTVHPYVQHRGIRQHINFTMDISSYPLPMAKEYIRRLARMKYNAITFHSYNGQWHPFENAEGRHLGGHFFYGQRHLVPRDPEIAACVDNRRAYCIPECEPILDEGERRQEFASWWLNSLIDTAKEAGMTVTLSAEPAKGDKALLRAMMTDLLDRYPSIDIMEWISPEGGSNGDVVLTAENAPAFAAKLFGEGILEDGKLPFCENPTTALGGTLESIRATLDLYEAKDEIFRNHPNIELRVGLYVMCRETLKTCKAIMNKIYPADMHYCFLPAHGAAAAADNIDDMDFTPEELGRTMLYSWVEFDGNMYIQQNSCGGIQRLMDVTGKKGCPAIYGASFNHWRTAENSLTISYAAKTMCRPLPTADFYTQYAEDMHIGEPALWKETVSRLEALDIFARDTLFNIGFCVLACWLNPGGLKWTRGWTPENIAKAKAEYEALVANCEVCLAATTAPEGLRRLRLLQNRCRCSAIHLTACVELCSIAAFTDDLHPEALTEAQKQEVRDRCARALECCQAYEKLHIQCMPDRGCQGTVVSYCATIPVFVDHIRAYFAEGETVCTHRPITLDAPPPPDAAFFH